MLPENALIVIGVSIASIIIAGLIGLLFWLYLMAHIKYDIARIESKAARYKEIKDGFGMVHLLNLQTDIIENLSVFPGTHHNGTWQEPHPAAAAAWFALVGKARAESPAGLLPAPGQVSEPAQLDLLTIFTQPTQSYAIIGGQQAGKTYQARRIAAHWLQAGLKPIVIGPKWDRGEWAGCELFGGEYNFDRVAQGMRIVSKLAQSRHADKQLSHKDHPIQPVFFDDWTAIRAKLESEAEAFILDATTLYASVNTILYFIIHLDTANAWGVGKVGAALHRNFYKLLIEIGTNQAGLIDRSQNRGFLLYPGESVRDKKPVRLFSGTGQVLLLPDAIIEPSQQERRIIELKQTGLSYKDISEDIWGSGKYGKFYNDKIDTILAKYGIEA